MSNNFFHKGSLFNSPLDVHIHKKTSNNRWITGISCEELVRNVIQILINQKIYTDSREFLLKYGHRCNDRFELEQMQIAKSQPAISFACVLLPKAFARITLSFLTTMYSFSTKTLFQLFCFVCNKNARYALTSTQSHAHRAKVCRRNASRVIEMNKIEKYHGH